MPQLEVKMLTVTTYLGESDEQMTVGDLIRKKEQKYLHDT